MVFKLIDALLLNPTGFTKGEVLFSKGEIIAVGEKIKEEADVTIDCHSHLLLPGLVDVHIHLRDPGFTAKEDIVSGTLAAAAGGFTTVCAMPNLYPYPDDPDTIKPYLDRLQKEARVRTYPYACITKGEKGEEEVDFERLNKEDNIRFFSDDGGHGIQDHETLERVFQKTENKNIVLAFHCELLKLRPKDSFMFAGEKAKELGYQNQVPNEDESEYVRMVCELAKKYRTRVHICHVSAKQSIEYIKGAKANGALLTAEASCHHLTLTDMDFQGPDWKMNPPLKSTKDRQAIIEALKDGTIDFIASDHAPHTPKEKEQSLEKAPNGIVSSETSFPVLYTKLVKEEKQLNLNELVALMTYKPAESFKLGKIGRILPGYKADFALVDLSTPYAIDKNKFLSKGRNTPYDGLEVFGKILFTIVEGKLVYERRD